MKRVFWVVVVGGLGYMWWKQEQCVVRLDQREAAALVSELSYLPFDVVHNMKGNPSVAYRVYRKLQAIKP